MMYYEIDFQTFTFLFRFRFLCSCYFFVHLLIFYLNREPYFVVFFFYVIFDIFAQGVKEGWYDGGSIAFAVVLVIIVTGTGFVIKIIVSICTPFIFLFTSTKDK